MKAWLTALIALLCSGLALALGAAMLALPGFAVRLPVEVTANLDASGVAHSVPNAQFDGHAWYGPRGSFFGSGFWS